MKSVSEIDLPWSWQNGRSDERPIIPKLIITKRPKVKLPPPRRSTGSMSGPPPTTTCTFDGMCEEKVVLECAEIALSTFNQKNLSKQEPEYELVDALNSIMFPRHGFFHCNFIARLKNNSDAEDKLFFAELKVAPVFPAPRICRICCILGPRGTETGLFGCRSCRRHPGLIQHPSDGFMNYQVLKDNTVVLIDDSQPGF